jgi:cyclohexa-1,5-dienecarbonyl-CoA hydratase
MKSEELVLVESLADGAFWHVMLNAPKANIIDMEMTEALTDVFLRAHETVDLKAVCISGIGDHFSFGASVAEHRTSLVADMLSGFHRLFYVMIGTHLPLLAAVRGQCLGGGLELAAFCHRVFASGDARLGQPEIRLGVIAPVASVLLSERVGRATADHLCISGEVLSAEDALAARLVDELGEDPVAAAFAYFQNHLEPHSASSLRFAVEASRMGFHRRFVADLREAEDLYLDRLQRTHDAGEGIEAFLEKRKPEWRNA